MKILTGIRDLVVAASEMIFPECCEVCGRSLIDGEELLCLTCDFDMPRTRIASNPFNTIHQRLATPGYAIEKAAAYFHYYKNNPYARMIQRAKYSGRPTVGRELARRFANELKKEGFFDGMDVILPMPLHFTKKLKRGYNQTEYVAHGLSDVTGLPLGDNLKIKRHKTQTRLSAQERLTNMEGIIRVEHSAELVGKHVLVVDDVITTGATMLTAIKALHDTVPNIKTSVIAIGLTHY